MKKKSTIDKLAHKYALNIKQIRGAGAAKIADFKNLNKNFYDDIESNNITIRDNSKLLYKIKDNSIKEFIYTNKEIPDLWKKKLNYENEVLDLISKDKKLLSYVGSSTLGINKFSINNSKFPKINTRYESVKSIRGRNSEINDSQNLIKSDNYDIDNSNRTSILSHSVKREREREIRNKLSFNRRSQMNEREVNTLMEDYKTTYPIKEKLEELYITSNYYNSSKDNQNKKYSTIDNLNNENNLINTQNTYNTHNSKSSSRIVKINNLNNTNNTNSSSNNIQSKKQKTFRQNIFNNLSPQRENFFYSFNRNNNNINKITKIINKNKNLNNEITDKENYKLIDIRNPIIKKNIESINFYGPYFSFCPSCRNKNLEYYNNLETNQCLELIHHIKKLRHKNPIDDLRKRKSSVSPIINSNIQKKTIESDKIINEDEKDDTIM